MVTDTTKYLIAVTIVLVVMAACVLFGVHLGRSKAESLIVEKVDTTYVHDTIMQYKPIVQEITKVERVPVQVEVRDTLMVRDTMYVYLDREQIVWQDEWSRVYASGILPQVDSVQHFITEKVVTKEIRVPIKQKSRWGLGIHAGYGLQFGQQIQACPYVGVGVSYDLLSW
jgi:hypothetical protein